MNQSPSIEFKVYYLIPLIVFAGLLFRVFDLETKGLWLDEIHSAVAADPDKSLSEVIKYAEADQPPVYFLVLHKWYRLTSYNDFDGRLLSIILGLLGIIAMYFLGTEFKDHKLGLLASFLTAINYFHIDQSRQVRFYPLVFLLATLSYLLFIRCLKRQKNIDFLGYTVFTGLLLNTHYFGMVVLASQLLLFVFVLFWKKMYEVKFLLKGTISGILAGLSFIHWLPVILSDLQIDSFHIKPVKWYFLLQYFYVYFGDPVTCIVFGILFLYTVRTIFFRYDRKITVAEVVLIGWITLGFLIPLIYSFIRIPMLEVKYSIIVLPAILLITSLGFDSIENEKWRNYLLLIAFVCLSINSFFYKRLYHIKYPPEQWREVTKEIMKSERGTQIIFSQYAWYYRYYFKAYKSTNTPLEPKYAAFDALLENAPSVWTINSTRYPDEGLSEYQQRKIDREYVQVKSEVFTDSHIKRYVRRSASVKPGS